MPLVDYDDNDSDEEDQNGHKPFSFTNFLFGNINEDGALESDYLDPEAKEHLENLDAKGLNCLTNQIRDVKLEVGGGDGESSSSILTGMSITFSILPSFFLYVFHRSF